MLAIVEQIPDSQSIKLFSDRLSTKHISSEQELCYFEENIKLAS